MSQYHWVAQNEHKRVFLKSQEVSDRNLEDSHETLQFALMLCRSGLASIGLKLKGTPPKRPLIDNWFPHPGSFPCVTQVISQSRWRNQRSPLCLGDSFCTKPQQALPIKTGAEPEMVTFLIELKMAIRPWLEWTWEWSLESAGYLPTGPSTI